MQMTSMRQRWPVAIQRVEEILTSVLLLILVLGFGYFLIHSVSAIRFPFPLDYGEGPLLNQAKLLTTGRNIYHADLTDYPYTIANYTPVYVTILALSGKIFGFSYAIGRTISVIAALMSATLIFLILHTLTGDKVASTISGAVFLASPYVVHWSSLVRVDLVALAFSLAGIFVVARWPQKQWSPLVSALLMIGTVFTRQSYLLAGPLAVAGWLFLQSPKRAGTFILTLVTGTLVLVGILNALTRGGFLFHIITANANSFYLTRLITFFTHLVITATPLLAIAAVELVSAIFRRRSVSVLPPLYFLGGFLSALTVGKVGASVNYFLELAAALSLVTGAAVARWRRRSQKPQARSILLAILTLQTIWLLQLSRIQTHRTGLRIQMQPELEKLDRLVAEEPGPILADEYMGLLVTNEHKLLLQPFEFTQLAHGGKWDQNRLIDDIRAGHFELILISDQPPVFSNAFARSRWTQRMWTAIQEAYEPMQVLAGTTIYRPRHRNDR